MGVWLLLFIVLPAVELALLVEIGSRIGTLATILLIITTGFVGAALARQQGWRVLRQVERDTAAGRLPAEAMVDGMILLVAGALLITPGVVTDLVGFFLLIPAGRRKVAAWLGRWFAARVRDGQAHVDIRFEGTNWRSRSGPTYDITPERSAERPATGSKEELAPPQRPRQGE